MRKVYVKLELQGVIEVDTKDEMVELKTGCDFSEIGTVGFLIKRIGSDGEVYDLGVLDGHLLKTETL